MLMVPWPQNDNNWSTSVVLSVYGNIPAATHNRNVTNPILEHLRQWSFLMLDDVYTV